MGEPTPADTRLAIMIYGYDGEQAEVIKEGLSKAMGGPVDVIGADGRTGDTVFAVIDDGPGGVFESRDDQLCMFLGFDRDKMHEAIIRFPVSENLPRPIFCVLTESNVEWTVERLISHLIEERENFVRMQHEQKHGKGCDCGHDHGHTHDRKYE